MATLVPVAASAGKIKLWMEECGGINGQQMGITANRLHPAGRTGGIRASQAA